MIERLRLQGFKAWDDSGDVRMAPLTVLFGTNSAGKTSLAETLLMLRQTVESTDRRSVLHLGDDKSLVEFGTYEDIVHDHDVKRTMEFEIEWSTPEPVVLEEPASDFMVETSRLGFSFAIDTGGRSAGRPSVSRFDYEVLDGDVRVRAGMRRGSSKDVYEFEVDGIEPQRRRGRPSRLPPPYHFHAFPDQVTAEFRNVGFIADLELALQNLLRSVLHVGPLREPPERLYLWSGEERQHVGQRGERAIETLLAARGRRFAVSNRHKKRTLDEIVASRLQSMGLIHEFQVRPIAKGRKEYEVIVRARKGGPEVKLTDVGFGVSQVLPILVECYAVPPGSVVLLEQPEIHLHPGVQADLADLFVDAIRVTEDGRPRNVQFLIESHSEHFLHRLQRLLAEEKLSPDEVALYFVDSDRGASRIESLDIDMFGNIGNWPDNFFGDEMDDLVARSEAQARRMAASAESE